MENNITTLHNKYTDESSTVINLEELLKSIENMPIEAQNQILLGVCAISEKNNKGHILETRKQINSQQSKGNSTTKKQKVISVKKVRPEQKKYINTFIQENQQEIEKLIKLNLEEFKDYINAQQNNDDKLVYYLLGLIKELNGYNAMSDEAYLEKDQKMLQDIKELTEELNQKILFIKELRLNSNIVEEPTKTARIIFLEDQSGTPFYLEDIDGYKEFFNSYAKVLTLLEEERPYNPYLITNMNALRGLTVSRDLKGMTRTFFDKVSENTYVIIGGIIQKDDLTTEYKGQIQNRYKYYLSQKSYILNSLTSVEFIERQEKYLNEVKEKLGIEIPLKKSKIKGGA